MITSQKGNIFALLFAAVGLTGVLGVVGMQTISGPVRTMTKVNQKNIAENDIITNGRIAILNATVRVDFDSDPTYEPAPFITPSDCTGSATIGGCLPNDIGAVRTDSWGTPYRYCVWDHGTDRAGSGTTPFLLQGRTDEDGFVIAVISAGANKTFETECEPYDDNATRSSDPGGLVTPSTTTQVSIGSSMRVEGTDDIAKAWSYAEAKANSGGLWSEASGVIDLASTVGVTDIQLGNSNASISVATGAGTFFGLLTDTIVPNTDPTVFIEDGEIQVAAVGDVTACSGANAGTLAYNSGSLEVCDGTAFINVSSGGGDPWRLIDADSDTSLTVATTSTGDQDTITMTTPGGTLTLSSAGAIDVSGAMIVDGNVTLGDAGTDTVTINGTIIGSDNTAGRLFVADGTDFHPIAISGDATIDGAGALTISTNAVEGSMVADDTLDFDDFTDTMNLDASTSITADGTEVLSIVNTGTGESFRVNDIASDTTPFVIDADGNVAMGGTLTVPGTTTLNGTVKLGDNVADLIDITTGMLKIAAAGTCGGGDAGKMQYDGGTLQYCNGTAWQSAAAPSLLTDIGNVKNGIEIAGNDGFVLIWDNTNTQWDVAAASGLTTGAATNAESARQLIDGSANDNDTWIRVTGDPSGFSDNETIRMATNGTEHLKVTTDGEVIIGFVTPDTEPTVDASAILKIDSVAKGVLIPRMDDTAVGNITTPATGLLVYNTDDNTFQYNAGTSGTPDWQSFATSSSSSGELADADSNTLVQVEESADENIIRFDTLGTERMQIQADGDVAIDTDTLFVDATNSRVGVGTATPASELDVVGDIQYTGTMTDVSDRRLKTDIHELSSIEMIDRLSKIKTYEFKMKGDDKARVEYGVMAQELEILFPELVHTAQDDMKTKSVNYMGLIAPMIEVSKSLKAENDMLKAEIVSLKDDANIIKAQIQTLNKSVIGDVRGATVMPYIIIFFAFFVGVLSMVGVWAWAHYWIRDNRA